MNLTFDPAETSARIVRWFRQNARDLPWRRTRDPYAIWISEVMLQQTQVKTVIPYWERWMKLFPTPAHLAQADEQSVLKAWEGLGYYRRARNLQSAARIILERYAGEFPNRFEQVLELPGVGRYTAGAICSIAFGQHTPILDGNVARVLSRARLLSAQNELWEAASELVRITENPSFLNQGLMELGATTCSPREPRCPECPLNACCAARITGRIPEFPPAVPKTKFRKRRFAALLVSNGKSILVRQRDPHQVNGALWEFPNFELMGRTGAARQMKTFFADASKLQPFATIRHTITNNRITVEAFSVASSRTAAAAAELRSTWIPLNELDHLPFSSAHAKLRKLLLTRTARPPRRAAPERM